MQISGAECSIRRSKCKGPEAGLCLGVWRNTQEAPVVGSTLSQREDGMGQEKMEVIS